VIQQSQSCHWTLSNQHDTISAAALKWSDIIKCSQHILNWKCLRHRKNTGAHSIIWIINISCLLQILTVLPQNELGTKLSSLISSNEQGSCCCNFIFGNCKPCWKPWLTVQGVRIKYLSGSAVQLSISYSSSATQLDWDMMRSIHNRFLNLYRYLKVATVYTSIISSVYIRI